MSNFQQAIEILLIEEGGLTNDPNDSGGLTNFGICQRDNPNIDIKHLTKELAIEYYKKNWWLKFHFDLINDNQLSTWMFSHAVNCGSIVVIKCLQTVMRDIMQQTGNFEGIQIDGLLGPSTAAIVNNIYKPSHLLQIQEKLWNNYLRIMEINPKDQKYYNGWHNRCFSCNY